MGKTIEVRLDQCDGVLRVIRLDRQMRRDAIDQRVQRRSLGVQAARCVHETGVVQVLAEIAAQSRDRLLRTRGHFGQAGSVSASARLRSVELYGTQVIPRVRELLAEQSDGMPR